MEGGGADHQSGSRAEVRPSRDDPCAKCGDAVGGEWVSYRQDAGDSQKVIQHFGGIVRTGPVMLESAWEVFLGSPRTIKRR
jgi:hypothetical protein